PFVLPGFLRPVSHWLPPLAALIALAPMVAAVARARRRGAAPPLGALVALTLVPAAVAAPISALEFFAQMEEGGGFSGPEHPLMPYRISIAGDVATLVLLLAAVLLAGLSRSARADVTGKPPTVSPRGSVRAGLAAAGWILLTAWDERRLGALTQFVTGLA